MGWVMQQLQLRGFAAQIQSLNLVVPVRSHHTRTEGEGRGEIRLVFEQTEGDQNLFLIVHCFPMSLISPWFDLLITVFLLSMQGQSPKNINTVWTHIHTRVPSTFYKGHTTNHSSLGINFYSLFIILLANTINLLSCWTQCYHQFRSQIHPSFGVPSWQDLLVLKLKRVLFIRSLLSFDHKMKNVWDK